MSQYWSTAIRPWDKFSKESQKHVAFKSSPQILQLVILLQSCSRDSGVNKLLRLRKVWSNFKRVLQICSMLQWKKYNSFIQWMFDQTTTTHAYQGWVASSNLWWKVYDVSSNPHPLSVMGYLQCQKLLTWKGVNHMWSRLKYCEHWLIQYTSYKFYSISLCVPISNC